jgi:hypothetical protein
MASFKEVECQRWVALAHSPKALSVGLRNSFRKCDRTCIGLHLSRKRNDRLLSELTRVTLASRDSIA